MTKEPQHFPVRSYVGIPSSSQPTALWPFADAREFALTALRNHETYGDRATDKIEKTWQLLADIESDLQSQGKRADGVII